MRFSDQIDNPNFVDTGHCVDWYFRLLIITERGIGHFDDRNVSDGVRQNISIVKNQIRL